MSSPNIAIVDYKAGNIRSVQKALEHSGASASITSDPGAIERADALVFPGQGANDSSMRQLKARGLVNPIKDFISSGKPFLGVCLGLQLLMESSEEGVEPGLGVLEGQVRRFLPNGLKVPHMGWNEVDFHIEHPVFEGIPNGSHFYFVHSYYADPEDKGVVAGTTSYGIEFCSAVAWDNVVAVQFHPEKSGDIGLKMYRNFASLVETSKMESAWKSSPR
ncbi:MAG: imidazole glycerol phosphate synthase subunit HisH [Chloroflexi bacterium]|nr:imidazole glycerol phosphate synthase subunit HisH [Chloroflexota bacterium]